MYIKSSTKVTIIIPLTPPLASILGLIIYLPLSSFPQGYSFTHLALIITCRHKKQNLHLLSKENPSVDNSIVYRKWCSL